VGDPRVFICDTDTADEEVRAELPADTSEWDYADWRQALTAMADHIGEWQGIPTPVDDLTLRLCPGHPLAEVYAPPVPEVRIVVGGPSDQGPVPEGATTEELLHRCTAEWEGEQLVNEWYDGKRNRDVLIFRRANGRAVAAIAPRAPDRSMDRLMMAVQTIGASDAWSLDAEAKAIEKLQTHVTDRQFRHYLLTGSFIETSKRSGLIYVFRRLRPTIVMTPRWPWYRPARDSLRVLAVLCMHPIGYYDRTWAGCMVPTDDVLAHLLSMRGDEAFFWRKANQHDPASPEAGL